MPLPPGTTPEPAGRSRPPRGRGATMPTTRARLRPDLRPDRAGRLGGVRQDGHVPAVWRSRGRCASRHAARSVRGRPRANRSIHRGAAPSETAVDASKGAAHQTCPEADKSDGDVTEQDLQGASARRSYTPHAGRDRWDGHPQDLQPPVGRTTTSTSSSPSSRAGAARSAVISSELSAFRAAGRWRVRVATRSRTSTSSTDGPRDRVGWHRSSGPWSSGPWSSGLLSCPDGAGLS